MSSSGSNPSIPAIRYFQMGDSQSPFKDSVNLFRGDINWSLNVVSMPARKSVGDLGVNISAAYQSHVTDEVELVNLTNPTSPLGVGWSMPEDKISLTSDASLAIAARQYSMESNSTSGTLILTKVDGACYYYQLSNYQPWLIVYDADANQWTVTHEDGLVYIYGGGVDQTGDGYNTSAGNSIAWGVRYGNWTGSTSLTPALSASAKPEQFAQEWHLVRIENPWADTVTYEYNNFERTGDGLLKDVEQFVGDPSGLPYTKAVYLTGVTDVFGRKATFHYEEKTFDDSSDEAPKEFQASHTATPNNTDPNAYQDRYQTKYLDRIELVDTDGEPNGSVKFDYYPLQNLTTETGLQKGATYKRYLKSITHKTPAGIPMPGYTFTYGWDGQGAANNPGAISTITSAAGGVAGYSYGEQSLDICKRDFKVDPPSDAIIGSGDPIPRVWFGNDYAIVTWFNPLNSKVWLGAYTWVGYWKEWTPENPIISEGVSTLDLDSMIALPESQCFGFSFNDTNSTSLFLFSRDPRVTGGWKACPQNTQGALSFNTTAVSYAAGNTFILASATDQRNNQTSLTRINWDWAQDDWQIDQDFKQTGDLVSIAGSGEYYAITQWNRQQTTTFELSYHTRDAAGAVVWNTSAGPSIENTVPSDHKTIQLATGSSTLAVVIPTSTTNQSTTLGLWIYQWDETYTLSQTYQDSIAQNHTPNGAVPYGLSPHVIDNTTVASGGFLFRYNGESWLKNQEFVVNNPSDKNLYWMAYGPDYTIQTVNGPSGITVNLLAFDPDDQAQIVSWDNDPIQPLPLPTTPPEQPQQKYHPSAGGGDYFTSGNAIYFRGTASDWVSSTQAPIFTIAEDINTTSIIDQAPGFLVYLMPDPLDYSKTKTVLLVLNNQQVVGLGTVLDGTTYSLQGSSGTASSGTNAFFTFPAAGSYGNLDKASSITLYRFAGDDIMGPIEHNPVETLSIDNGYGETQPISYFFDPASAACDVTGKVVQYYTSTEFPGSATVNQAPYGSRVTYYLNSQNNDQAIDYYINGSPITSQLLDPALNGLQQKVITKDANDQTLSSKEYTWGIYTIRNSSPTTPDATPENLFGSYSQQQVVTTTQDGVASTTTYDYIPIGFPAPYSGQPITQSETNFNGQGEPQNFVTAYRYGYEIYPEFAAGNALKTVVQTTQTVSTDGGPPVTISVTVSTWKNHGGTKWATYQSISWNGASDINFPFPTNDSVPAGWIQNNANTQVSAKGQPIEMVDTQGRPNSVVFDANLEYTTAQFQNASVAGEEANYWGFESNESNPGWTLDDPATIVSDNGYTGYRSLQINQGGSIARTFTPSNQDRDYVYGVWYKTPSSYEESAASAITLSIEGGSQPTSVTAPFVATDNTWQLLYVVMPLSSLNDEAPLTINASATNAASQPVYIDSIRFLPEGINFSSYTYELAQGQVLTQTANGKQVDRVIYDQFGQNLATGGSYEDNFNTANPKFSSRQINGTFDPAEPNAQIRIQPLSGGKSNTFFDNDTWKSTWTGSNADTNFVAGGGLLQHTSATESDTLTLNDASGVAHSTLLFELAGPTPVDAFAPTTPLGIAIGEDTQMMWDPSSSAWSFTVAGQPVVPLHADSATPLTWCLVALASSVHLFINGRLLLSYDLPSPLTGDLKIVTGENRFAFRSLSYGLKPQLAVNYSDGQKQDRQSQSLVEGNTQVFQSINDAAGQQVAVTKTAPARFNNATDTLPLLAYIEGFVDVTTFLGNLDGSGVMDGYVSDYFDGSHDNSNDQGYPYKRTRFEAAPDGRPIEQGLPGKDYAIIDSGTTDPSSRPTVQFVYSNNSATTVASASSLPGGSYTVVTRIDEMKNSLQSLADQQGDTVFKGAGSAAEIFSRQVTLFTDTGRTTQLFQPNYNDSDLTNKDQFVSYKRYDHLSNLIESQTPDRGKTEFVTTDSGKIRFILDGNGTAQGYYVYIKYDGLDNVIEKGIINGSWDRSQLQSVANDASYPTNVNGQEIQRTVDFVQYADSTNGIGQTRRSVVIGQNDAGITTTTTLSYDNFSQIQDRTVSLESNGSPLAEDVMEYVHSPTGRVLEITYPDSSPIDKVFYQYDVLGRMTGIGQAPDDSSWATYGYSPSGNLASESFNGETLDQNIQYNSPGWTESVLNPDPDNSFSESITQYQSNGLIKSLEDEQISSGSSNELQFTSSYDTSNRVKTINYVSQSAWDLDVTQYDFNGNMRSITSGGNLQQFAFNDGTNQLNNITNQSSGESIDYGFDDDGNVKHISKSNTNSAEPLELTYQRGGLLPTRIDLTTSKQSVLLDYGSRGSRVSKQLVDDQGNIVSQTLYTIGLNSLPLVKTVDGESTAYIHGLRGLVAFKRADKRYFVSTDHQSSTRSIFDEQNTVINAYAYSNYGERKTIVEGESGLIDYLFSGEEFDQETGLYNFRARLYDIRVRRFLAPDPKNEFVSLYLYTSSDPINFTDPTGESEFLDIFTEVAASILSVAEITAGIAIDVLSAGALAEGVGGALLGAGLATGTEIIVLGAQGELMSGKQLLETQVTGLVVGAATAGVGAAGDALADAAVNRLTTEATSQLTKSVIQFGVKITVDAVGGSLAQGAGKMIENGFEGNSAFDGVGTEMLIGLADGAIGSVLGNAAGGISKKLEFGKFGRTTVSIIAGVASGGASSAITYFAEGDDFTWLDMGINLSAGAVGSLSSGLKTEEAPTVPANNGAANAPPNPVQGAQRPRANSVDFQPNYGTFSVDANQGRRLSASF